MGATLYSTSRSLNIGLFLCGYNHLWFILMLFSCFLAGRLYLFLYEKFPNKYFVACSLFITAFISYHPISWRFLWYFGIIRAEKFFFWFLLGMLVLKYRNLVLRLLNIKFTIAVLLIIYIGSCIYIGKYCEVAYAIQSPFAWSSCFSAVFLNYYIVNKLLESKKIIQIVPLCDSVNKCSYGIYIFHYWIILLFYQHKNIVQEHLVSLANKYSVIYPIISSSFCLIISYFITKNILKTKRGRFLVG